MTKNKRTTTTTTDPTAALLGDSISAAVQPRCAPADHSGERSRQDRPRHSFRRPNYVSVRQAAYLLGVPASVIHRAIRSGMLPAIRRHARLVVEANDVRRLMLGGAA